MKLITTTDELAAFCKPLADAEFVAVDTEFMRERTYWPKLCLAQVAGPDEAAAIDALAEGIDLAPLDELMANPKVLKVFHAARQDLEIFYLRMNSVPAPLFDTQVAAMVCGHGEAASLRSRWRPSSPRRRIDKSSRFTDWSRRPLSERQITYAISDVTHLRVVYEKLKRQLEKTGRLRWIAEEMAVLNDPGIYRADPEQAWRRLKPRGASPRLLGTLKEVAAWRERTAQRIDIPRQRLLRDEQLLEIASHAPKTVEELALTRGLGRGFAEGWQGREILEAIEKAAQAARRASCRRATGRPSSCARRAPWSTCCAPCCGSRPSRPASRHVWWRAPTSSTGWPPASATSHALHGLAARDLRQRRARSDRRPAWRWPSQGDHAQAHPARRSARPNSVATITDFQVEGFGRALEAAGRDVAQAALERRRHDQAQLALGAAQLDLRQQAGRAAGQVVGQPQAGAEPAREGCGPCRRSAAARCRASPTWDRSCSDRPCAIARTARSRWLMPGAGRCSTRT